MREKLKSLSGKRIRVFAVVSRFGKKKSYKGPDQQTVCLVDVKDMHGNVLTNHIWLTVRLQLKRLGLKVGDAIKFTARSAQYMKGYKGNKRSYPGCDLKVDFTLKNPSDFVKITPGDPPSVKEGLFEWAE